MMKIVKQKGSVSIIVFIVGIFLVCTLIIGTSIYLRDNQPGLVKKLVALFQKDQKNNIIQPEQLTDQEVLAKIQNLLTSNNLEIKENVQSVLYGCLINGDYTGRIDETIQYVKDQISFDKNQDLNLCYRDQSLREQSEEIYWVNDNIYQRVDIVNSNGRNIENDPGHLTKITDRPFMQQHLKPSERLNYFFLNPQVFDVISIEDQGKIWQSKVNIRQTLFEGNFIFTFAKNNKEVVSFSYSIIPTANSLDYKKSPLTKGNISIVTPTAEITLPDLP